MLSRGRQLVQHVLPAVIRPLRVLWNQIIGFVFLVFAVVGMSPLIRDIRKFEGEAGDLVRIALAATFVLFMAFFAVQSFWRARKSNRA